MDQKITDLHDKYTGGSIDRREFLKRLSVLTGGTIAAHAIISRFENNYAFSGTIRKKDPPLFTEYIEYPGETGKIRAYHARPDVDEKFPGVIVIHENRGLNPHIEDVTRRMAREGFYSIAPDALSPLGGTPEDTDEARTKM
ncbi:MAG: dienelactone hydrolase family protein, partial [bacterium]|nr:dienelactone hydrolase family protein [bacterium]